MMLSWCCNIIEGACSWIPVTCTISVQYCIRLEVLEAKSDLCDFRARDLIEIGSNPDLLY